MTFFRREAPGDAPPAAAATPAPRPAATGGPAGRRVASVIAEGTRFEGTVSGAAELVVEGEIEGMVQIDGTVFIAPSGRVRGEVSGRSVQIGGNVSGNVRGRERVELTPSATLEGNIASPRVVIAEGAFFKGGIEMTDGRGGATAASPEAGNPSTPAAAATAVASKPEPVRAESAKIEASKPDAGKPEASKAEASKAEAARIEAKRGLPGKG